MDRPVEPPPSEWMFPTAAALAALPVEDLPLGRALRDRPDPSAGEVDEDDLHDGSDLVALGADLEPGTILAAYRVGLFPMPEDASIGWWCPAHRGVLPLDGLHVSRSLRRSLRRFEIRVDTAFEQVMRACGDPRRPHGWIDERIITAYTRLHELGWAHSVEVWREDRLVGGLYGLEIGGLFAGESMFHHETDASKVALVGLVEGLRADEHGAAGRRLVDVQWASPHLMSLGVRTVPRSRYVRGLAALAQVPPSPFLAGRRFGRPLGWG